MVQGEVCLVATSYGSKSQGSNTPTLLGARNFYPCQFGLPDNLVASVSYGGSHRWVPT